MHKIYHIHLQLHVHINCKCKLCSHLWLAKEIDTWTGRSNNKKVIMQLSIVSVKHCWFPLCYQIPNSHLGNQFATTNIQTSQANVMRYKEYFNSTDENSILHEVLLSCCSNLHETTISNYSVSRYLQMQHLLKGDQVNSFWPLWQEWCDEKLRGSL